ncbi:MAG TPA: class II fructose-bisphosphate aldolase [Longimicrobiaceae bacterium]|nr:class II fructose-bisphosphate aldolase [Longimicrobiaceae bacterium]
MAESLTVSGEDRAILDRTPVRAFLERLGASVRVHDDGRVEIENETDLRGPGIDALAHAAALGEDEDIRDTARWIIGEVGAHLGIRPASIHDLYAARGRGEVSGFTVPAMNLRAATYDTARALFSAAVELKVGTLILEIARSEIGYTDQRPAEYVAVITAAAIREGWSGPLFFQGDHVQINAKKYAANGEPELHALRDLIREEIHAGFYNIDVDTSTLVDLSKGTLEEQQRTNVTLSAAFTDFIRHHEPPGVTISVGGEIGEVGTENSTPAELRAYMDGYNAELKRLSRKAGRDLPGLSKISVQSGTSHGGVVLPDGSIKEVAIDFETLRTLSEIARREYGLSGAVQHGASTLPADAFHNFPKVETAEIHLATGFQNIVFDHPALPAELRERMYDYARENFPDERKPSDTEEQFLYKARKKTLGVFKRDLWELPEPSRDAIRGTLREQFAFLFRQLAVPNTMEIVRKYVSLNAPRRSGPAALRITAAEDDWDLSD